MIAGEEPVKKQTDLLYAMAGRYHTSTVPNLKSEAATFVLPSNLEKVLNVAKVKGEKKELPSRLELGLDPLLEAEILDRDDDCYQAHMVTFKENPYNYGVSPDLVSIIWVRSR